MKSSGNGKASVCAENLLKCVRFDVPYERTKGLNPRLIDSAMGEAAVRLKQDAELIIEVFEPRAVVNEIRVEPGDTANGGLSVTADIREREA